MTLRIERDSSQGRTLIRLSGRMQSEHLADLKRNLEAPGPRPAMDLGEVTLVDAEAVRFLLTCEDSGFALLHCPPYIRRWMAGERPPHP